MHNEPFPCPFSAVDGDDKDDEDDDDNDDDDDDNDDDDEDDDDDDDEQDAGAENVFDEGDMVRYMSCALSVSRLLLVYLRVCL